ncbi:sugar MFS transporter [Sphingobium sp.]|uniref:sugar MFS transporter n=1 Tax=Sphingobium sp. TaxID=1912891 RepID=UPI0039C95D35
MAVTTPSDPAATAMTTNGPVAHLRWFVMALFFTFGGITSLNDVLIPKLKHLFTLSYGEAMLIQSAFFLAYLLISLPAGMLVQRIGYMRSAVAGLLTMTAGCLLFLPASQSGLFITFLAALFVLASGITIVQVVANPLISALGNPATASSRLTFAQAFNSLGTTVFPYVGAMLILGNLAKIDQAGLVDAAVRAAEARVIDRTYVGIALALTIVAGVVWLFRNRLVEARQPVTNPLKSFDLLKRPRFAIGTVALFLYVGAEVAIGSLMTNYLMQADTLALPAQSAGERLALYWGGAMIGRFIGAELLRRFPPANVLLSVAVGAITLIAISTASTGHLSGYTLLMVGLMNAIMFPTIFSLASEGLGIRAAEGSGIICMAIVGGAVIPPLTGLVADETTLRMALIVPVICYAGIMAFARYCRTHPVIS